MHRRHFVKHLLGASAWALPALTLTSSLRAQAGRLSKDRKAAILIWLDGGASSLDMWDLKPGAPTSGPFRPIATTGEMQICEHLPQIAQQMQHLSVVRSMSTREADHTRASYFMHTGFEPNPSVEHPSYGSVAARELDRPALDIPPFVSIGGNSVGPGFLGMTFAPFVVNYQGRVNNLDVGVGGQRLSQRVAVLETVESGFMAERRGSAAGAHRDVLKQTLDLVNSEQMQAFRVEREDEKMRTRYGDTNIGRGCLLARRLVEAGVPFIEVRYGGWDNHQNIFSTLKDDKLPQLDQALSALVADLDSRGLLENTAVVCMGEFGRTPRINGDAGRDHWARSWSVVVGGAGFAGGRVIGATNEDGTEVVGSSYSAEDLMASVCQALSIPLSTTYQSKSGRPMKIANGGTVIDGLFV